MTASEVSTIAKRTSFSYKEIIALQQLPLADKEQIACAVIAEALSRTKHTAAIAFSGGKDSEVVADLIERNFPDQFQDVHCIYGNTGIEFPESLHFAREYGKLHIMFIRRADKPDVPYYTVEVDLLGEIVQVRGLRNCKTTPEVQAFIEEYKQHLAAVFGKEKQRKTA